MPYQKNMFCVPNPKHQKVYKNYILKRSEMVLKLAVVQLMMAWSSNVIVEGKENHFLSPYIFFSDF